MEWLYSSKASYIWFEVQCLNKYIYLLLYSKVNAMPIPMLHCDTDQSTIFRSFGPLVGSYKLWHFSHFIN